MHESGQTFIWNIAEILNILVFLDLINDHPITEQLKFCNNENSYDRPDGGTYASLFIIVIASQFVDNLLPGDNFTQNNEIIGWIFDVVFYPFFAESFSVFF